jgi:hypothetical protein
MKLIVIYLLMSQLAWAGKELPQEPIRQENEYTSALRIARQCQNNQIDDFYENYPDELEVDVWILKLVEKDIIDEKETLGGGFFVSAYVIMDLIRMEVLMGLPVKKQIRVDILKSEE